MDSLVFGQKAQSSFWEHMFKKCVVRLGSSDDYKRRKELLSDIRDRVLRGAYSPQAIHGFLSCPKSNGVARFVPVLTFSDLAIYFGCVKALDETLAELAVEGTYGGWTLGGKRREFEREQAQEDFDNAISVPLASEKMEELGWDDVFDISIPVSSYNRWAWVESWQQYWKLLAARFEHAPDGAYFVSYDIANFYDTIDLPRLERLLRKSCPKKTAAIEVLCYFLSTWNRQLNQYARTTKGIPMDIVGDCSRVLANFHLTPFDSAMKGICGAHNADFMRFADDMILACPDRKTCSKLIFKAAGELHRIGLNINVSKVRYFTKEELGIWWGFDVMDKLEADTAVADGLGLLRARFDNADYGRRHTALKRATSVLRNRPELADWRQWVYTQAMSDDDFIIQLSEAQMRNLVLISDSAVDALNSISVVVMAAPFTQPKACLLRCLESFYGHSDDAVRDAAITSVTR